MPTYGQRATKLPKDEKATKVTRVLLQARVTPEQRVKANDAAKALGISLSAFVAELVDRLEVDEHGHPGWESKYAAPTRSDQQLDLTA